MNHSLGVAVLAAILTSQSFAGPTHEVIHRFQNAPPYSPQGELVQDSQGTFYGTSRSGGALGNGTIFKVTPAGEVSILVHFTENGAANKGSTPRAGLLLASDGNLYGTTEGGGTSYGGTVFKTTRDGALTTLVNFTGNGTGAPNNGSKPRAALVEAPDGSLYGTTFDGGAFGYGTVFKMTRTGVLTTLVEFTANGATNKGAFPVAGLVRGPDGNFYGTTSAGGTGGYGTIFKMSAAGALTTLMNFNWPDQNGNSPEGKLAVGNDGNLYGTTAFGGRTPIGATYDGSGTVFRITPAGIFTSLVSFTDNGNHPLGALIKGSDGNFYGTTYYGGIPGYLNGGEGTVFKVTPTGSLTTVFNFNSQGGANVGTNPNGGLLQASDGSFYGMTNSGNNSVYRIASTGTVTRFAGFRSTSGAYPDSGVVQGSDGYFYGTTPSGGINGAGAAFRISRLGVLTTLHGFTYPAKPAGLVQSADGNLYGTTKDNNGTIFRMSPAGTVTKLLTFSGNGATNKGTLPTSLVRGTDGYFYGATYSGGTFNFGTLFKTTPTGTLTTLVNFTNNSPTNKGAYPDSPLVRGSDGNYYGTTYLGGTLGYGTIFRVTPTGTLTTLVNFSGQGATNKGAYPSASLIQGRDGNFYGTTKYNGFDPVTTYPTGSGTIFKMTPAGNLTTLVEFSGNAAPNKGANPSGAMLQYTDGNFYGTTSGGGAGFRGTIFKMTPAGSLTTLVEFNGLGAVNQGAAPTGPLIRGNDGNIYGTTSGGGYEGIGNGTIFCLRFGPTPVTTTATLLAQTAATLNGTMNPNGLATTVRFEIGTSSTFAGATMLLAPTLPAGNTAKPVSLRVTGLVANARYYFRVIGQNTESAVPQIGAGSSFNTLP